jgi:hypothetical protein
MILAGADQLFDLRDLNRAAARRAMRHRAPR